MATPRQSAHEYRNWLQSRATNACGTLPMIGSATIPLPWWHWRTRRKLTQVCEPWIQALCSILRQAVHAYALVTCGWRVKVVHVPRHVSRATLPPNDEWSHVLQGWTQQDQRTEWSAWCMPNNARGLIFRVIEYHSLARTSSLVLIFVMFEMTSTGPIAAPRRQPVYNIREKQLLLLRTDHFKTLASYHGEGLRVGVEDDSALEHARQRNNALCIAFYIWKVHCEW